MDIMAVTKLTRSWLKFSNMSLFTMRVVLYMYKNMQF